MSPILALALTAAILVTGTGVSIYASKKATIDAPRKGIQARRRRGQAKNLTKLGRIDRELAQGKHINERSVYRAQMKYWKKNRRLVLGKTYTLSEKADWQLAPMRKMKRFTPRGLFIFKRVSKKDQSFVESQIKYLEAKAKYAETGAFKKTRIARINRRLGRLRATYNKKVKNNKYHKDDSFRGNQYIRTFAKGYNGGIQDNRVSMQAIESSNIDLFEELDKLFPDAGKKRKTIQVQTAEFVLPTSTGYQNPKVVANDARIYRCGKLIILKSLLDGVEDIFGIGKVDIFPLTIVTKESEYPTEVKEVKIKNQDELNDYYLAEAKKALDSKYYPQVQPVLAKVDAQLFPAVEKKTAKTTATVIKVSGSDPTASFGA